MCWWLGIFSNHISSLEVWMTFTPLVLQSNETVGISSVAFQLKTLLFHWLTLLFVPLDLLWPSFSRVLAGNSLFAEPRSRRCSLGCCFSERPACPECQPSHCRAAVRRLPNRLCDRLWPLALQRGEAWPFLWKWQKLVFACGIFLALVCIGLVLFLACFVKPIIFSTKGKAT